MPAFARVDEAGIAVASLGNERLLRSDRSPGGRAASVHRIDEADPIASHRIDRHHLPISGDSGGDARKRTCTASVRAGTSEASCSRAIREHRPTAMTTAATDRRPVAKPPRIRRRRGHRRDRRVLPFASRLLHAASDHLEAVGVAARTLRRRCGHTHVGSFASSVLCVQRVLTASSLLTRLRAQRRRGCGQSETRSALRICTGREDRTAHACRRRSGRRWRGGGA